MAHLQLSSPTTRDLAKLLAAWLSVIVLLQAFAAVHARVLGPLHLHRSAGIDASTAPAIALFSHRHGDAQHFHDGLQRHHHSHDDTTVVRAPDAPADGHVGESLSGTVLAALYSVTLPAGDRVGDADAPRHVWWPAPAWSASIRDVAPPKRPPRV